MTTFAYTIVLNDSERIMIEAALNHMIELCDKELADGPKAPFWAHKNSAQSVLKKLDVKAIQMSGNSHLNCPNKK